MVACGPSRAKCGTLVGGMRSVSPHRSIDLPRCQILLRIGGAGEDFAQLNLLHLLE